MSKVWFITGAGSGIGTEIAKAAMRAGDRVVASSDAISEIRQSLESRLQEIKDHEALSRSTDGNF